MGEERFKLSKSAIPSQLSNFCDEDGMMLNSEVVRLLNDRDALQESNVNLFFLIKESESKIKRLEEDNKLLKEEVKQYWKYRDIRKQKVKDLEKQLNHIQNLIYKDKMQRLEGE